MFIEPRSIAISLYGAIYVVLLSCALPQRSHYTTVLSTTLFSESATLPFALPENAFAFSSPFLCNTFFSRFPGFASLSGYHPLLRRGDRVSQLC